MDLLFRKLQTVNRTYLALAVFALLIAGFYGNTLQNGFIYDDRPMIETNEYIHSLKYAPKIVTGCLWEFYEGGCKGSAYPYYRPFLTTSVFVTYQISSQPWIFHLVNLLLFLAAGFLVFLLAKLLTKNMTAGFVAAVIFLVHPLNSEAANWISAQSDIFAVIFISLTAIFYIQYRQTNSFRKFLLVLFFYFVAMLAKEPAILLPLVFVSLDMLFFNMSIKKLLQVVQLKRYALFGIPAATYFVIWVTVVGSSTLGTHAQFSFLEGLHARITLFAQYIWKSLYPHRLSFFHPFEVSSDFFSPMFLFALATVTVFVVAIVVLIWKRQNFFAFCLLWFAVFLVPPLLFLVGERASMLTERYVLISSLGFAFMIGKLFAIAFARFKWNRQLLWAVLVFLVLVSWFVVFQRNKDWKDEKAMYEVTLQKYPNSSFIRWKLGELHYLKGDKESARREFEIIIRENNDWEDITLVYKGLGDYWRASNDSEKAFEYYTKATEASSKPRDYVSYNDLGVLYMNKGEYLNGFAYFCQSLRLYPQGGATGRNLTNTLLVVDTEYTQKDILYQETRVQFEKAQDDRIVFRDKRCDEKVCQYAFSFRGEQFEALFPELITGVTSFEAELELSNQFFDRENSMIFLDVSAVYEHERLTFLFPTCTRTYYEADTVK